MPFQIISIFRFNLITFSLFLFGKMGVCMGACVKDVKKSAEIVAKEK